MFVIINKIRTQGKKGVYLFKMEIGIYDFAGAMVFERAYHNNIFDDLMYKITHNSR